MLQRFTNPVSGIITAADTAVTAFPTQVVGVLYLQAGSGNAGTVKIKDSQGAAGGLILTATTPMVAIGPLLNLESLSYQFSVAGDTLNYLTLGLVDGEGKR